MQCMTNINQFVRLQLPAEDNHSVLANKPSTHFKPLSAPANPCWFTTNPKAGWQLTTFLVTIDHLDKLHLNLTESNKGDTKL